MEVNPTPSTTFGALGVGENFVTSGDLNTLRMKIDDGAGGVKSLNMATGIYIGFGDTNPVVRTPYRAEPND